MAKFEHIFTEIERYIYIFLIQTRNMYTYNRNSNVIINSFDFFYVSNI